MSFKSTIIINSCTIIAAIKVIIYYVSLLRGAMHQLLIKSDHIYICILQRALAAIKSHNITFETCNSNDYCF